MIRTANPALNEQVFEAIPYYEEKTRAMTVQGTVNRTAVLLVAYTSRLIKPTENFKLGVVAATGGICLLYFVSIIMNLFGSGIPLIHSSGPWGIAFSVFIVIVAALNLVLDFDFIETGAASGAPKYMEWYAAFGLIEDYAPFGRGKTVA